MIKQILTIELTKISVKDIRELKESPITNRYLGSLIPQYTFNEKTLMVAESDYYFQFTGDIEQSGEEAEYFKVFNIVYKDKYLDNELSCTDLEELPVFIDKIPENLIPDFSRLGLDPNLHLVFGLSYTGEGEDVECEIQFLGYLDEQLALIEV